jgi:hypothetical protein
MMRIAYTAIKRVDPNAIVISGGLSPTTAGLPLAMPDRQFLEEFYKAGGKDAFDMLGLHAPGYRSAPETDPAVVARDPIATNRDPSPEAARRIYSFRHVEDMRAVMVANGDSAKKVAIMEFGYTTDERPTSPYRWHAITEESRASYLVRAFQFADKNWADWVGFMSLIYICAPHWRERDEQWWWAITYEDGSTWLSYDALREYLTKNRGK